MAEVFGWGKGFFGVGFRSKAIIFMTRIINADREKPRGNRVVRLFLETIHIIMLSYTKIVDIPKIPKNHTKKPHLKTFLSAII